MTLAPTPLEQWDDTVLVRLPSGRIARLRAVDMALFVKLGRIPDELTAFVDSLIRGKVPLNEEGQFSLSGVEELRQFLMLLDAICEVAFVEPRVTEHGGADSLSVNAIPFEDKQWVFGFFNAPVDELKKFRLVEDAALESVRASGGDGDEGQ